MLRITPSECNQDGVIQQLIEAASAKLEDDTQISLLTQSFRYRLRKFLSCVILPRPPLVSVESVKYIDADGAEQTVDPATYRVYPDSYPGIVAIAPDQAWPTDVEPSYLPVSIEYTAGYATRGEVRKQATQALMLLVGHWYEHRIDAETFNLNTIPNGYEQLSGQLKTGEYSRVT